MGVRRTQPDDPKDRERRSSKTLVYTVCLVLGTLTPVTSMVAGVRGCGPAKISIDAFGLVKIQYSYQQACWK